jgi:hypothetical protein
MLLMLGRHKYIQVSHWYLVPVILRLKLLLQSGKSINPPDSDHILAEHVQGGGETLVSLSRSFKQLVTRLWESQWP